MLSDGGGFSVEDLRRELAASAGQMGKRAPSMLAFMSQRGVRRDKRKSRRKQPYQPGLALQSYLLQEAEAVGREAKLRAARGGLRAVSLQHDGVSFLGVPEGGEEAWGKELSVAVTLASGYQVEVEAKRCLSLAAIGIGV